MKTSWIRRWAASALLTALLACPPLAEAQSPGAGTVSQDLHLVCPAHGKEGEAVRVRYTLTADTLIVNYKVTTLNAHPEKMADAVVYNGNVVELFICTTAKPAQTPRPYYEFEVSPYNQELQVLIDRNGKFNEEWKTAEFKHSVTIQADRPGWDAELRIPLRDLGWKGDSASLVGNTFAILGARGGRRFYSAHLPPQQKPNFHLPNFFKPFPLTK